MTTVQMGARPAGFGLMAFGLLFALYFGTLTLVSGWLFALGQFAEFWYYLIPLGLGFGLQVALYVRLREMLIHSAHARTMMTASGTTSSAAMVSCCAHYLVNIAPVLGASGLVTFATQYQVDFFWIGLAFNATGIAYIATRLLKAAREHA